MLGYCIECEREVLIQDSKCGLLHEHSYIGDYGMEYDVCFMDMGWTSCPPPEFEEYWQDNLIEPGDEEVEQFNSNLVLMSI